MFGDVGRFKKASIKDCWRGAGGAFEKKLATRTTARPSLPAAGCLMSPPPIPSLHSLRGQQGDSDEMGWGKTVCVETFGG
jgi:hypothetical protein